MGDGLGMRHTSISVCAVGEVGVGRDPFSKTISSQVLKYGTVRISGATRLSLLLHSAAFLLFRTGTKIALCRKLGTAHKTAEATFQLKLGPGGREGQARRGSQL